MSCVTCPHHIIFCCEIYLDRNKAAAARDMVINRFYLKSPQKKTFVFFHFVFWQFKEEHL